MLKSNLTLNPARSRSRRDPKGLRFGVLLAMALAVVLVAFAIATGQQPSEEPPPIDGARRAAVVDTLAKTLRQSYVFADAGKKMAEALSKQLRKKAYASLSDPQAFAEALTRDMRAVTNDRHLRVGYNPEQIAMLQAERGDSADAARVHDEELAMARAGNFGFRKVERLSGNIGYLAFDRFSGDAEATETAAAALTFLRDVDALIFDMRQNGGGSPRMIQYISSYLFDGDARHLNTFYLRKNDSLEHFFTYPHIQGGRLAEIPVYVLTSGGTFSAAEEFTYNLKHMERATIVGDTTGGGAHPVDFFPLDGGFFASVSIGRAINPITQTNWEGVGVIPDIAVPQEQALDAARMEAMKAILAGGVDADREQVLTWHIAGLDAELHPITLSEEQMQSCVGTFGPRTVTLEDGALFYQREGRPKFQMTPMADDLFRFEDLEFFRLRFVQGGNGVATEVVGLYDNGQTDRHTRSANN